MVAEITRDEETKTILSPPWKELVKIAEGWEYGSFHTDIEITKATGAENLLPNKKGYYFYNISMANKILLTKGKLLKRAGTSSAKKIKDGYEVVKPDDYPVLISRKIRRGTRQIKGALEISQCAPVDKMSDPAKKQLLETVDTLKSGFDQIKKLDSVAIASLLALKPRIQLSEARPGKVKDPFMEAQGKTRVCPECKKEKPELDFWISYGGSGNKCKDCTPLDRIGFPNENMDGDGGAYVGDKILVIDGDMKGKTGRVLDFSEDERGDGFVVQAKILFENNEKKLIDLDFLSFVERPADNNTKKDIPVVKPPKFESKKPKRKQAGKLPFHIHPKKIEEPSEQQELPVAVVPDIILSAKEEQPPTPAEEEIKPEVKEEPPGPFPSIGNAVIFISKPREGQIGKIINIIDNNVCVETEAGDILWPSLNEYERTDRVPKSPPPKLPPVPNPLDWKDEEKEAIKKSVSGRAAIVDYRKKFPESKRPHQSIEAKWRSLHKAEAERTKQENIEVQKKREEKPEHMKNLKIDDYVKHTSGSTLFTEVGQVKNIKPKSDGWEALVQFRNGIEWIKLDNLRNATKEEIEKEKQGG